MKINGTAIPRNGRNRFLEFYIEMVTRKYIFFLLLLFFAACYADIKISASLMPSSVYVGDKAELTVAVEYAESVNIRLAIPSDSVIGGFNIESVSMDSIIRVGAMQHREIHYRLAYFNIADNMIPPLGILAVYPDGSVDTALTQPIRVTFRSLLGDSPPDSLDIKDVKSPHSVALNIKKIARNFLIAFGIFVFCLIVLWLISLKKRGIGILEFIAPKKSPWEIASMQLDALAESDMLEKGEFKEYFDRLTDILRGYIEGRFGIGALELSTTETMDNLKDASLGLDAILAACFMESTEILLKRADMVKFAKFLPDIQTALLDMKLTRKLVEDTIPKPIPEETGKTGDKTVPESEQSNRLEAR